MVTDLVKSLVFTVLTQSLLDQLSRRGFVGVPNKVAKHKTPSLLHKNLPPTHRETFAQTSSEGIRVNWEIVLLWCHHGDTECLLLEHNVAFQQPAPP